MPVNFTRSSKREPCPLCPDSDQHGDCRFSEGQNVILCHRYVDQPSLHAEAAHYKYLHASKDQMWGVYVYQEVGADGKVKGRKQPRKQPARQPFYYPDRQGNPLVMAVRVSKSDGRKEFYQYKWDGVEWQKGLNEYAKLHVPIYRYSEVRQAISQGKAIFMAEGEGKADSLWDLGLAATTTLGGSKKYRSYGNYFEDLKDAQLVLCPDRDKVGLEHMEDIARDFPEAQWCYVFPDSPLWKHLPDNGGLDIADWLADGATVADILAAVQPKRSSGDGKSDREKTSISKTDLIGRVKNLELIESPVDRLFEEWDLTRLANRGKRELMELAVAIKSDINLPDDEWAPTFKDFAAKPLLQQEWLFQGFLKAGRVTLVAAESKTGKSLLHYDWSYCLATGNAWGEFPTSAARPVIVVQTDEPETDSQERIKARGLDELNNGRIITKFMPQHMPRLRRLMTTMGREGMLVLDSLGSINRFSGYSPKDPEYGYFVYELKDIAAEMGWGIVVITHTNKNPIEVGLDKIFGSQYIVAAASDILLLYRKPKAGDEDTTRLLRRLGGRSGAAKTWSLDLNLEDYSYDYQGECDKEGEPLQSDDHTRAKASGRQRILAFLQANAPTAYESREIAELLVMNSDRVRSLCGEMFRNQLLLRKASGEGKANRAKAYYLPNPFQENSPTFEAYPSEQTPNPEISAKSVRSACSIAPPPADRTNGGVPIEQNENSLPQTGGSDVVRSGEGKKGAKKAEIFENREDLWGN